MAGLDDLFAELQRLPPEVIQGALDKADEADKFNWLKHARPEQLPPPGNWRFWLILAGRGFGKTRCIAEYAKTLAKAAKHKRIAILGPTAADVRDVLIEGDSGILSVSPPDFMPVYEPSKRQLTWPNGVIGKLYSAEEPERLRGPQHHAAIVDEIAAYEYPEAFTQLKFGLRLGADVRCAIATTPKPCSIIRELVKQSKDGTGRVVITRGRTYDNKANLAPEFFQDIITQYEGTRLGRQEIDGELLEDTPGALWNTALLERTRVKKADMPAMARVVIALDPSVTSNKKSDECGVAVVGKGVDGDGYMLEDLSGVMTPNEWASAAIAAFHRHSADVIIGEANNGGDLVGNTILALDPGIPFRKVNASRGKHVRAEPISLLSEQNRFHLVGSFAKLEEQMCAMAADGYTGSGSPDRLDALVWGASELMLGGATVQMFSEFRSMHRGNGEPTNAVHVYRPEEAPAKDWWQRWVSASIGGGSCAAHWWLREPSGRVRVYRELLAADMTPEEFGRTIAANSTKEIEASRMVPVWLPESAFEKSGGKSLAVSISEGIQKSVGTRKAFLFVHNDAERSMGDAVVRWRALNNRLDQMPDHFMSVQPLTGSDSAGWDLIREMLRWRNPSQDMDAPDIDHARKLLRLNDGSFEKYMEKFRTKDEVLPVLMISSECRGLIQAMSGAVRGEDDSAVSMSGTGFVLQSLRVGGLAARETRTEEPMSEYVGRKLDRLNNEASPMGRYIAAVTAEQEWSRKSSQGHAPISFRKW